MGSEMCIRDRFMASLSLLSDVVDVIIKSNTLRGLGYLARIRGEWAESEQYLEQSLAISRAADDEGSITWSLIDLAILGNQHGKHRQALAQIEEGLTTLRRMGHPSGILIALGWLGNGAQERI